MQITHISCGGFAPPEAKATPTEIKKTYESLNPGECKIVDEVLVFKHPQKLDNNSISEDLYFDVFEGKCWYEDSVI